MLLEDEIDNLTSASFVSSLFIVTGLCAGILQVSFHCLLRIFPLSYTEWRRGCLQMLDITITRLVVTAGVVICANTTTRTGRMSHFMALGLGQRVMSTGYDFLGQGS